MREKDIPILYYTKNECCGCGACNAVCSRNAITMLEDVKGFVYPQINENKCIRCYMCLRVCPFKEEK